MFPTYILQNNYWPANYWPDVYPYWPIIVDVRACRIMSIEAEGRLLLIEDEPRVMSVVNEPRVMSVQCEAL
jgi:hypothetical protein